MSELKVLAGKRVEPGDLLVLERRRDGTLTGRVKRAPKRPRRNADVIGTALVSSVPCEEGHLVLFRMAL